MSYHKTLPDDTLGSGTANDVSFLRGDRTWAAPVATAGPHTHPTSDVTGLDAALAAKSDVGHTHADPWTVVKLAGDFPTSSATAVDVTGMAFAVQANSTYLVECYLFLRTATATVGPRPGVAWPTGLTDGVAFMQTTSAAGTIVMQNGNLNAAVLGPVGGLPNTTQSWPAQVSAQMIVGASPGGTWKLQLASETAGTNVTLKAGSILMYRKV